MRFALLAALCLTACGEPVDNAPKPGHNITLPPMEWRVRDRATLEGTYLHSGEALGDHERLHGFVGMDGEQVVIYTLPPKTVDDAVACTLGHEVMHVALGSYHR